MSISIHDLPLVESAERLGRHPAVGSPTADAYRVSRAGLAQPLAAASLALGLKLSRFVHEKIFPTGPDLTALVSPTASVSYTTFPDCTVYDYNGTCAQPCFGFAPENMSSFFCATCDEQHTDPANNPPWNWHFTGS